jgi:serine/threonine protein kinase
MNARLVREPAAPRERHPELSPAIEAIVRRALEPDPARRFQSAAEMRAALEDYAKVPVANAA